jgi:hypothetical protein
VVSCLSNGVSVRFAVLFGCQHPLRRFIILQPTIVTIVRNSYGREGDQQCNTAAQTMVVPDIGPPQSSFVHT